MATTDNSPLQPVPGGDVTMLMLARAIKQRTSIEITAIIPCTVKGWTPPVEAGLDSKPAFVWVQPDHKYARPIDVPDSAAPGETVREDPARGWIAVGQLPEIYNVPVIYPGPAGMQSRGPIQVGEGGVLLCSDRAIDDWIQIGPDAQPVMRHARHSLTDALFLPGLRYGQTAESVDPLLYYIGFEDQTAGMSIHATTKDIAVVTDGPIATVDASTSIKLGANATLGNARLNDKTSSDTDMTAWLVAMQSIGSAAAAFLGLPLPIYPSDFGFISQASTKVVSE